MYEAKKTQYGTYEIFFNGNRVATGSADVLPNYGLSETQLTSNAPAPTAVGTQTSAPASTPVSTSPVSTNVSNPQTTNAPQPITVANTSGQKYSVPTGYDYSGAPSGGIVDIGGQKYIYQGTYLEPVPANLAGASAYVVPQTGGTAPQQAPQGATGASSTTPQGTGYTGPSIVDYLSSVGKPSDFSSRQTLAQELGIQGYIGTAEQNTQMLNILKASPVGTTGETGGPAGTGEVQPQGQPQGQPQVQTTTGVSTYQGPSIVDYLNSTGQPSDFVSRTKLAAQFGIQNYKGTAEQNTQLLHLLRQGETGVSSAESVGAGVSGGGVSDGGITGEDTFANDIKSILESFGIKSPNPLESPQNSFTNIYEKIYTELGIPTIKKQYEDTIKAFGDLQNELNGKISDINDNPWFSEGIRVQKIEKLKERYEGKLSILTNQMNLYKGFYDSARDDAQFITGQAMTAYNRQQNLTQDFIFKAIDIAEKRAEAKQKLIEVSPGATLFDPQTGQPVYTAPTKSQTKDQQISGEETTNGISSRAQQIIDGFTSLSSLTPSEQAKAKDELFALGFNSDTPPDWFVSYIQDKLQQSLLSQAVQEEWIKYRDKVMGGGKSSELNFDNL